MPKTLSGAVVASFRLRNLIESELLDERSKNSFGCYEINGYNVPHHEGAGGYTIDDAVRTIRETLVYNGMIRNTEPNKALYDPLIKNALDECISNFESLGGLDRRERQRLSDNVASVMRSNMAAAADAIKKENSFPRQVNRVTPAVDNREMGEVVRKLSSRRVDKRRTLGGVVGSVLFAYVNERKSGFKMENIHPSGSGYLINGYHVDEMVQYSGYYSDKEILKHGIYDSLVKNGFAQKSGFNRTLFEKLVDAALIELNTKPKDILEFDLEETESFTAKFSGLIKENHLPFAKELRETGKIKLKPNLEHIAKGKLTPGMSAKLDSMMSMFEGSKESVLQNVLSQPDVPTEIVMSLIGDIPITDEIASNKSISKNIIWELALNRGIVAASNANFLLERSPERAEMYLETYARTDSNRKYGIVDLFVNDLGSQKDIPVSFIRKFIAKQSLNEHLKFEFVSALIENPHVDEEFLSDLVLNIESINRGMGLYAPQLGTQLINSGRATPLFAYSYLSNESVIDKYFSGQHPEIKDNVEKLTAVVANDKGGNFTVPELLSDTSVLFSRMFYDVEVLSSTDIDDLIKNGGLGEKVFVSAQDDLSEKQMNMLLRDPDERVRWGLSHRRDLPLSISEMLKVDASDIVRKLAGAESMDPLRKLHAELGEHARDFSDGMKEIGKHANWDMDHIMLDVKDGVDAVLSARKTRATLPRIKRDEDGTPVVTPSEDRFKTNNYRTKAQREHDALKYERKEQLRRSNPGLDWEEIEDMLKEEMSGPDPLSDIVRQHQLSEDQKKFDSESRRADADLPTTDGNTIPLDEAVTSVINEGDLNSPSIVAEMLANVFAEHPTVKASIVDHPYLNSIDRDDLKVALVSKLEGVAGFVKPSHLPGIMIEAFTENMTKQAVKNKQSIDKPNVVNEI